MAAKKRAYYTARRRSVGRRGVGRAGSPHHSERIVRIFIDRGASAANLTAAREISPCSRVQPDKDERCQQTSDYRSGTNPNNRNRDRDTQAKRAENRQDELRKQIRLGPHIR